MLFQFLGIKDPRCDVVELRRQTATEIVASQMCLAIGPLTWSFY